MSATLLVYGAYGYTGELIVARAKQLGIDVIAAGRNEAKTAEIGERFGVDWRVFALDNVDVVAANLRGCTAVLHCAGPFEYTYRPMASACLQAGVHYLDITGEATVFEGLAQLDSEAQAAGIMLLPGVGFDVVPSDCLAKHLSHRLPGATHLRLAFRGLGSGISHGTATTMAINLHRGGLVRACNRLVPVPLAWKSREIDYRGDGHTTPSITIPWGDVVTAWYSTGIPNIEVYTGVPRAAVWGLRALRPIAPLLGAKPVVEFLKARIDARPAGPDAEARKRGVSELWGEVSDGSNTMVSRLRTPEGYTLTVATSLLIAQRVLAGNAPAGFQTPAKAYGADLILEVDGVERYDA